MDLCGGIFGRKLGFRIIAELCIGLDADNRLQDEVVAARPDIDEKVSQLVAKGRWDVPGYKVCLTMIARVWRLLTTATEQVWRSVRLVDNQPPRPCI